MKWIKASERLPEKRFNYHVKVWYEFEGIEGTWNTASLWNGEYWEHPTQHEHWTGKPSKLNTVEWLDESAPSPLQEAVAKEVAAEYSKEVFGDYDPEQQDEYDHFYQHLLNFHYRLTSKNT